jgi:hypothetical protein
MKRLPTRAAGLLCVAVTAGFSLGGCASPGGMAGDTPALPTTPTTTAAELKPTTFGVSGPAAAQYSYPSFGAPKQIGDRTVMTPAETTKMQTDLEALAKQREQQLLQSSEEQAQ